MPRGQEHLMGYYVVDVVDLFSVAPEGRTSTSKLQKRRFF